MVKLNLEVHVANTKPPDKATNEMSIIWRNDAIVSPLNQIQNELDTPLKPNTEIYPGQELLTRSGFVLQVNAIQCKFEAGFREISRLNNHDADCAPGH